MTDWTVFGVAGVGPAHTKEFHYQAGTERGAREQFYADFPMGSAGNIFETAKGPGPLRGCWKCGDGFDHYSYKGKPACKRHQDGYKARK